MRTAGKRRIERNQIQEADPWTHSTFTHLSIINQADTQAHVPPCFLADQRAIATRNNTGGNINKPQMGATNSADSGSVTVQLEEGETLFLSHCLCSQQSACQDLCWGKLLVVCCPETEHPSCLILHTLLNNTYALL